MRRIFRLMAYLRRHWQLFFIGIVMMLLTTAFGGASLTMLYPILKRVSIESAAPVQIQYDSRPILFQISQAWNDSKTESSIFCKDFYIEKGKLLKEKFQGLWLRNDPYKELVFLCVTLIIFVFIKSLTFYFFTYIFGVLEELFCKEMRDELFARINTCSLVFFDKFRTGDLISRMVADIELLKRVVVENVAETVYNFGQIMMYLAIAFVINRKLTLFVLVLTPPFLFVLDFIARKLKKYTYKSQVEAAGMVNVLEESISSIKVIMAFVKHKFIQDKFAAETTKFFRARRKMVKYNYMNRPVSEYVSTTLGVIVIWFSGKLILDPKSNLDFVGFMVFFAALYSTFQPMRTLSRIYNDLQKGLGVSARYFEVYDYPPDIVSPPDGVKFTGLKSEIKLDNVSFSYDGGKEALHNINLTIKKGEVIALVGPSGGGKTTITNLIPRFYDPTEGAVLYDGIDLRKLDLNSLRGKIGIVTQETLLFHDTVFNNIAFGRPETAPEKVYAAAEAANAHEFIIKLTQGYDTFIGERGSRLSGGQKQRIAIARAILNDPEIIIFDEATSSLDSEAELLIQQAMDNIVKGRTVIVIAHRLSTIRNAHRILVVEKGRIVEEGVHEELMKKGGEYKYLHDLQYGG